MAFMWAPPKSATQVLDGLISPHRTLFQFYDKVRDDLGAMLDKYKNLQPSMHSYAPGVKSLAVTGTIPIVYKNATYNVLLTIWIPYAYPGEAPSVSVIPTDDLAVPANHSFVSPQGHVDFKKLGFGWDSSYHSSFLVETLQQAFGNEPPLRRHATPPTYSNPAISTQLPPAYKQTTTSSSPIMTGGSNVQVTPGRTSSPNYAANPSPSPSTMTGISPTASNSEASAIQAAAKAIEKQKLEEALEMTSYQLFSAYEAIADEARTQQKHIQERSAEWQQHRDFYAKKLESAQTQKTQLEILEKAQLAEIQLLESIIAQKSSELEGQIDYDRYAEPEDPILKIALPFHAKDLAIDDAQYHLEKALQNNTIDLKQFLKATRELANDQYYQRAMLRKLNVQIPMQNDF
jgi:ESCRT-I complex subunit TSG101